VVALYRRPYIKRNTTNHTTIIVIASGHIIHNLSIEITIYVFFITQALFTDKLCKLNHLPIRNVFRFI